MFGTAVYTAGIFFQQLQIVRRHHYGRTGFADVVQQFNDGLACFHIQISGRLVCQNNSRRIEHGTCDNDALLFAARRMDFVFHKAVLADEMSDLYDAVVRDDDRGYAVNTALYDLVMPYASRLGSLRDMTKELKLFHRDLWHAENRPIHWDVVAVRYDRMLLEWETQYDRIQLDLQQQARTGMHLPREQGGFRFDRPKS